MAAIDNYLPSSMALVQRHGQLKIGLEIAADHARVASGLP